MPKRKTKFLSKKLGKKEKSGLLVLLILLLAIPITLFAVGNPVNLISQAVSRSASKKCAKTCTTSGYQTGFALGRYSPDCHYKIGNCCCIPQRQRVSPPPPVLPDLQITDLFWAVGPKTYVSPALVYIGRQKYFAIKIFNSEKLHKTVSDGKYWASSSVKNVKLGLWLSCQSKWGFPGLMCEQGWAKIEKVQLGIEINQTTDPTYGFSPVDSISYVIPGASPRLVFLSSYRLPPRPWCPTREATAKFKVCADPENKIKEGDETNNCFEKELSCDIFELEYDF